MLGSKAAALLLLITTLALGASANDLVLQFKVVNCYGRGEPGVKVTLTGCVDTTDNDNKEFAVTTDANGLATFDKSPLVVQYCYGAALGYCRFTAKKDGKTYSSSIQTLQKEGRDVTAREYTGCQCNGKDYCQPKYYYDADPSTPAYDPIVFTETCCAKPSPSPHPSPPPPPKCPTQCSFQVKVKKHQKYSKYDKSDKYGGKYQYVNVAGLCSSNFNMKASGYSSEDDEGHCPAGYINSKQPCDKSKDGKDCGVCCVAATSLCGTKSQGRCAKKGGQCMCLMTKKGASCKLYNFPEYIMYWGKKNKNPKYEGDNEDDKKDYHDDKDDREDGKKDYHDDKDDHDDDKKNHHDDKDNHDDDRKDHHHDKEDHDNDKDDKHDEDHGGYGHWSGKDRRLLTFGWEDIGNGGGCEESLCNAVAAKGGFSAACCPFGCD